jgi:hypothetical protein
MECPGCMERFESLTDEGLCPSCQAEHNRPRREREAQAPASAQPTVSFGANRYEVSEEQAAAWARAVGLPFKPSTAARIDLLQTWGFMERSKLNRCRQCGSPDKHLSSCLHVRDQRSL